jgi:hypothetical protein
MKKILIIETEYEGHYLTGYIKYILRSFKNQNTKIILLISAEATNKARGALKILKKEKVKFSVEKIHFSKAKNYSTLELLVNQIKLYFDIKKKFIKMNSFIKFDHVFLTSLQKFDKTLWLFGSPFGCTPFSGIFLGSKFHLKNYKISFKSRFNFLSKNIFQKILNIQTLKNIITNDHLLHDFANLQKFNNAKKIEFLHDPKEFNFNFSKRKSRKKLCLPKKAILILVYGALIDSKGIAELLSIFSNKKIDDNIKVVLAGKQLGIIKNYIANNKNVDKLKSKKKLFFFNKWIDELTEALLFSAVDIVWIGYKNYSSPSGVLYQAVQKSLPVIISNDSYIGNLNKKIKVGCAVNIYDSLSIISGINFVIDNNNKHNLIANMKTFSKISKSENWVSRFKKIHANLFS